MIPGVNYPWTIYEGRPNYGCDFGRNRWNSHAGVTAHLDEVRADFDGMAADGFEVARWFVFTDGRGGVDWHTSGELAGIADRLTDDMDAAVDVAGAAGVRLCLVLIDFTWLDDPARRAALESTAFIDRVLDPFLDRYGAHDAIHSYDVINEPDCGAASTTRVAQDRPAISRLRRGKFSASAGVPSGYSLTRTP